MKRSHRETQAIYEIRVAGELDQSWEDWLDGLEVRNQFAETRRITALTGCVADQAALRGLLCKLWDLNLTLISVRRMDKEENDD